MRELKCKPQFATRRTVGCGTKGDEVADIARLLGFELMPWQKYVADVALEFRSDGRPRYREVVVTVPRQCGKSVLLLCVVLHRMLAWGVPQTVTYNAQGAVDASHFWRRHWDRLRDSGFDKRAGLTFAGSVADTRLQGRGSVMRCLTSSPSSGHGMTIDLAVVDEAMAFVTDDREQALLPAMRAVPDAQLWIVSTMGDEASVWFNRKVERGRSRVVFRNGEPGAAYFEWGAHETADPDDEEVWQKAIPAMGHTIFLEQVRLERESMPDREFRRAALNQPYMNEASSVVPWDYWQKVCTASPSKGGVLDVEGPVWVAVDSHPDRRCAFVAICVSGWVQVVCEGEGVDWLAEWLVTFAEIRRRRGVTVVASKTSAVAAQVLVAESRGVKTDLRAVGQVAAACGGLYDACLSRGRFTVKVVRDDVLDDAMRAGCRRWTSGGWVWAPNDRDGEDVSALTAAALAFDGWRRAEEAPPLRLPTVWLPHGSGDGESVDARLEAEVREWQTLKV